MKIVALSAENVKRLTAIEIRPDGNLVQITGRNGQGKTSVLDAIWWALAGATHIQAAPIRKGANEARIRLDLGEIVVTRTFKLKDDATATTAITVENADGARFPSPQRMLDSLLGELAFDPLAFTRMDPKAQFDTLRRFVPGVDFDAIAKANADNYARRTEVNRKAKEARIQAQQIDVDPALAEKELVDESALIERMQEASQANTEIEQRKVRREQAQAEANQKKAAGVERRERASKLREQAAEEDRVASALLEEAAGIEKKIDAAPPLPEMVDLTTVREKIEAARAVNRDIQRAKVRAAHIADAEAAEAESKALTKAMDDREQEKRRAIAAADLPVKGIAFGDGLLLLDGVPFDQASDAERLRASIAIAMASNPKLRVIRVRDGSLLDEDAMKILADMADGADYQVWIERVDGSGKIGFVLEDGHLKAADSAAVAAE